MDYLVVNGGTSELGVCNCWIQACWDDKGCTGDICGANGCNRLGCCTQGGRSLPTRLFPESK
ncbi:MAG: hypothetical protein ACRCXT_20570 [Paraclostridium sp.]